MTFVIVTEDARIYDHDQYEKRTRCDACGRVEDQLPSLIIDGNAKDICGDCIEGGALNISDLDLEQRRTEEL